MAKKSPDDNDRRKTEGADFDPTRNTAPYVPQRAGPTSPDDWQSRLSFRHGGNRRIETSQANLVTILEHDPRWHAVLGFNVLTQQVERLQPAPWHPDEVPSSGNKPGPWTDDDDTRLRAWLERSYEVRYKPHDISAAVTLAARNQGEFHPVRRYIESLSWDGAERLLNLLPRYFGAHDDLYARRVGTWTCIAAVARAFLPGCKVDTVLVLEGPQGLCKSQALQILAGPSEWFSDTPLHIGDKDGLQSIQGKWIVELAELQSLHGRNAQAVKAFLSSPSDRYRPSYGRRAQDFPRQCIFIATTNELEYLNDASGARRFWPIYCTRIDLDALRADRDQLWAEAFATYKRRPCWWPVSDDEHAACREAQTERRITDPWETAIRAALLQGQHAMTLQAGELTTHYVLTQILQMEPSRADRGSAMRVGDVLRTLGYERKRARIPGQGLFWVYHRPRGGDGR